MGLRNLRKGGQGALGSGASLIFRALGDGSIVPELGTAGSFTRAATQWYPSTAVRMTLATSGNPCVPAFAPGLVTTKGGYYVTGSLTNYLIRSNEFTNAAWTVVGSLFRDFDIANGPDNVSSSADLIQGIAGGDLIRQITSQAAGSNTWTFGVWLRRDSGEGSVVLRIKDQAGTPQEYTNTVNLDTTWRFVRVVGDFTAATGNIVVEIQLDNKGVHYVWEAVCHTVEFSLSSGTQADFDLMQNISTTTVAASATIDNLQYAGAEITASRPVFSYNVWVYVPDFTNAQVLQDKNIFTDWNSSTGARCGAKISSADAQLHVSYGENSYQDTNTALNKGAWNMVTIVVDTVTDIHTAYLNGALINTTSVARSATTSNGLVIGGHSTSLSSQLMWNSIVGEIELYSSALDAGVVLAKYNATKGFYDADTGESLTGASFALKLDEASGNITDEVAGLTLAVNSGTNTYRMFGPAGYGAAIKMNAVAGGFRLQQTTAAGDFGTGDGNIFVSQRWDGVSGSFPENFITTVRETGLGGWSYRARSGAGVANSISLTLTATDATTVTATWTTATILAALDVFIIFHTVEFRINRTAATVELFFDGVSQGTVSISSLAGKLISQSSANNGFAVGQDLRAGINRNVPITVAFCRVKKAVT